MAKKNTYVTLQTLVMEPGKALPPQSEVELEDNESTRSLVARGVIVREGAKPVEEPTRPSGKMLIDAITAVIPKVMETPANVTATGLPSLLAVGRALGYAVSEEERDVAWTALEAKKETA